MGAWLASQCRHPTPGHTSRHPLVQGGRTKASGTAAPHGMPVIPGKVKDVSILEKAHQGLSR